MRTIFFWLTLCLAAVAVTSATYAAQKRNISIGTGGVKGLYYPTGGHICSVVNEKRARHGIRCSADSVNEPSDDRGSISNLQNLRAGQLEFGIAQSVWHYHAYKGTTRFFKDNGPFRKLRSVFALHAQPVTLIVRRNAGIKSATDLQQKRVNIGPAGSGTRGGWNVLQSAFGWSRHDFKHQSDLRAGDAANALCRGEIDAMIYISSHPSALTKQVLTKCKAQLADISGPAIDRLVSQSSFYRPARILRGFYNNRKDVHTFGVGATLVTNADVPEDIVYNVVKSVFDDLAAFRKRHPMFVNLDPREMIKDSLTAPLHRGAKRYYAERGWIKAPELLVDNATNNPEVQTSAGNSAKQKTRRPADATEKRVALVIGNSKYQNVTALKNPKHDAKALSGVLESIGYEVELKQDLSGEGLRKALSRFARKASQADIAAIYFAGHGMEMNGENFLIPVDAQLSSDTDLEFEAVKLTSVMRAVGGAKKLRLIMLDACRDNPFAAKMQVASGATRAVTRGLARVEPAADNVLVAYAARAGTVAMDGAERHSPFAKALLEFLPQTDLEVRLLFGKVRDAVRRDTNNQQVPYTYGTLGGDELYIGSSQ